MIVDANYHVSSFQLGAWEEDAVLDALRSNELSWHGKYVGLFEKLFAEYTKCHSALACSSGTAALHLALKALDVGPSDVIIVPALTYVATANAVKYCGARPIICDVDLVTWNLDPKKVEDIIAAQRNRVTGIIPVHLYGVPCAMDELKALADHYNLFIIEDAAQALGATYRGQSIGSLGDLAAFSLYANKVITTGEGGMVTCNNSTYAERVAYFRGQCQDTPGRYFHSDVGFNYRMTNLQGAIGHAQLCQIRTFIKERERVGNRYRQAFAGRIAFQHQLVDTVAVDWMFSILVPFGANRNAVAENLRNAGIETRPVFTPLNQFPMYLDKTRKTPIADDIANRGLNLPTHPGLTNADVDYIVDKVFKAVGVTP